MTETYPKRSSQERKARRRAKVWDKAEGRCCFCDGPIDPSSDWEIHHAKPKALGGGNRTENLHPAHPECHVAFHQKDQAVRARYYKNLKPRCRVYAEIAYAVHQLAEGGEGGEGGDWQDLTPDEQRPWLWIATHVLKVDSTINP